MSALSKKLRDAEGGLLHFWCPGCSQVHGIKICPNGWVWDGDVERPTFSPSVLVTYYQMAPEGKAMIESGQPPPDGKRYPGKKCVCHSFVKDGSIQFLNDCTHALSGKTVPLPDWTELGT